MGRGGQPYLLIADDDPHFLRLMELHLRRWSYRFETTADKGNLLRRLAEARPALLLLDVRFGEHDGVEILRQLLADYPGLRVAMLTAFGSIDNAIAAIRLGACDYLTKPVDLNRLRGVIEAALAEPLAKAAGPTSPTRASANPEPPGQQPLTRPILGESRPIRDLRDLIGRVAATDATVLILGESGTGKELVARAIHELSPRRNNPFVPLNVAALPRELVESTLFGHVKGAFSGADRMQHGCCEAANGGTLFLDEIGEMEIGLQAKLLRFLQEQSFQRVGQATPVTVDVRIVAATNRDPAEQVRVGQLRQDLYYRLNVVPIQVPPLRARREDVPTLAAHYLATASARCRREPPRLSPDALAVLMGHDWRGNVRELANLVERLAILVPEPEITADRIRAEIGRSTTPGPEVDILDAHPYRMTPPAGEKPMRLIDRTERDAILRALASTRGSVREAARELGLSYATIYRKLHKYSIDAKSFGEPDITRT
ncbi:MAG: sigma-54 dependent transcriptional regulator [Isosphaeraceae bacterium]